MKTGGFNSAATRVNRRLLADTRGSMTIPGIFFFAVLMAGGGLAIDMQRVYGVHGTMQAFVDDVALAAAAELDGQSDALTRSFRAGFGDGIGPLVSGPASSAKFATNTTLTVRKITFLSVLGADPGPLAATPAAGDTVRCTYDDDPDGNGIPNPAWSPANCNTDAARAQDTRFVEIVAMPRSVSYVILPIFNAFANAISASQLQTTLQLKATAGFRRAICNNVPLMVCNPAEVATPGADFDPQQWLGHGIFAKIQGPGWGPGEMGLLDNFPGNGANAMADAMATVNPGSACTEDTVPILTGAKTGPVENGMNVRFGMYANGNGGYSGSDSSLRPAPNVVKGLVGCANQASQSTQTMPFPRDNCFMLGPNGGSGCTWYTPPGGGGGGPQKRYGDGQWARAEYWATNHPGVPEPPGYNVPVSPANPTGGWSRYDTYRYEIEHLPAVFPLTLDETGAPSACYSGSIQPETDRDHDRRVLYVGVVNCASNPPKNAPIKAYAKVFLTEPVGNTEWCKVNGGCTRGGVTWPRIDPMDLFIEIIGVVKPNDESGHLHVYPVLYR